MAIQLKYNIQLGDIIVSYRELWFIAARPQIQTLLAGAPDNHIAAITLLIPWMERVYNLEHGNTSDLAIVARYFFPTAGVPEGKLLSKLLNSVKHSGFIPTGYVLGGILLNDAVYAAHDRQHLQINSILFCAAIRTKIDQVLTFGEKEE